MQAIITTLQPMQVIHDLPANPATPAIVPSAPDIQMTGATTTDARTLSVNYNIAGSSIAGQTLDFNVYRAPSFNSLAGAQLIGTASIPGSDTADLNLGSHQGVQLQIIGTNGQPLTALTPNTALPFLVVVANPNGTIAESDSSNNTASFETHVLGVVVHGLEFNLKGTTPSWETQMATALQQTDGYEAVIAFNWVRQSGLPFPGLAVQAAARLEQQVVAQADQLAAQHPGDVVDINFIGHSRGSVVVSQALQDLVGTTDPALKGGYIQMTMLDPHPANDFQGLFSWVPILPLSNTIAEGTLIFQLLAQDPQVIVPSDVTQAEEFDQQTLAGQLFPTLSEFLMNLWGEPPTTIPNQSGQPIESMSLTGVKAPGVGLVGHDEVHQWYQVNVVNTNKTFTFFNP
jgi:hypothetical protein